MTTAERELIDLVLQLPPELQGEVRSFAEFLLHKQQSEGAQSTIQAPRILRQDWAGALATLAQHYDSVTLQHQATDWMSEDALKNPGNDVSR